MKSMPGEAIGGRRGRWRWVRIPALAVGLLLTEHQLLAVMGTPTAQVRTLRELGRSPTDPVTPLLAVLTLLSEALIGYILLLLVLRTLSLLPGSIGGLTGRAALRVSPGAVRKLLDLLVGGTLLAQATLAAMPSVPDDRTPDLFQTMTTVAVRSIGPVGSIRPTGPAIRIGPAETRPPPAG